MLVDYHEQQAIAARRDWERLAGTLPIPGASQLLTLPRVESQLAAAQRATFSKAIVELRDLRVFAKGLAPEALPEEQIEMWSAAGQALYSTGDLKNATPRQVAVTSSGGVTERFERPPPSRVLDAASRALVVRLHNEVPRELRATGKQLDAMFARLEQTMVADSALNHLRLRPQIGREIVRRGGHIDFATLNAWIYAEVFHTPKQDAWLGLLPRDAFTGLLGDGVVIR